MLIFDCPDDECEVSIIGKYSDLREHVWDEHPLKAGAVARDDGKTWIEQIEEAQKNHLKQRINEEMVIDE